ncbi:MAG TPA: DNA mismatch repair endonuclease MutL, partial [Bacilli bacterium]|nr:DNA mismatch repair endonuclease MutL [Bacilli bacterium]
MSKIKIMAEDLANKIAAGEVVESCASVVKELVENSIDAQSDEITISLVEGGLKEIKVVDNGTGMDEKDALLAFSRHATSKLLKEDDLYFIDTLGFRGEALPSIAAVSIVNLKTCIKDIGFEVNIEGGKLISKNKCEARKGTTISIKDLFYNTPARLKYLKGPKEELALVTTFLEKLALSKPGIKFTLLNNEKNIFKTSGSGDLLKTIYEIYGLQVSSNMISVQNSNNDYDLNGYVCKPVVLKSNRNHLIVFVNGRMIRNNDLNRAINDAYYTYKPVNKFPIVILNINADPTLIDVNIHPTKQDIKLSKKRDLNDLITNTIKKALYESDLIPEVNYQETTNIAEPNLNVKEEQVDFNFQELVNNEIKQPVKEITKIFPVALVLGTYIICQNEKGIYLIDQHAA